MASGGKRKTTMAKLARENKLRERRADKQARKDARKLASAEHPAAPGEPPPVSLQEPEARLDPVSSQEEPSDQALREFADVDVAPVDPRAKEVALTRLHDSPDEELAVFADRLRDDALEAGASEQEMRRAQQDHPGHGG